MNSPDRDEQLYIWHHELHERWGKERLYFWRLAFFPTYDRQRIATAIEAVMKENDVRSFALYETLGLYDLVLRIWLPVSKNFQDFERDLDSRLRPEQLEVMDVFTVGAVVRHWPWLEHPQDSEMIRPDKAIEGGPPTDDELRRGNEAARGRDDTTAKDYVHNRKLLAPCGVHDGIKFIIVVTATAQLTTLRARTKLREALQKILIDAGDRVTGSLYEGSGFGQFLILGGVPIDGFDRIARDLIDPIIAADLGAHYGARPYTYVCAGVRNPLEFRDELPVEATESRQSPSARELLERDEGQTLEVKASAFVNIHRWLQGAREADDALFKSGVIRAVVGMLNAEGGEVVIGALEKDRFPDLDLDEFPVVGAYSCIGVDIEFGIVAPNWDKYALHLGNKMNAAVEPPPTGLVTIERDEVDGKSLAILKVRATSGTWYYVKDDPKLYVREGNATKVAFGPEADAYREAKRKSRY
jgi:hypothetical protein